MKVLEFTHQVRKGFPGFLLDSPSIITGYLRVYVTISRSSIDRLTRSVQAEIYTSAWSVTHDVQNFHEPMKFKPERWINADCKDIKTASQPFSLGMRGCVGRKSVISGPDIEVERR